MSKKQQPDQSANSRWPLADFQNREKDTCMFMPVPIFSDNRLILFRNNYIQIKKLIK